MIKDSLKEPKIIDITHNNVNKIKSENIVAFTFAAPGAQGEGGALIIGYKEKSFKIYYTNLYYTNDNGLVDKILNGFFKPFLINAQRLNIEGEIILDSLGYLPHYTDIQMGFGNSFYIKNEYYKDFEFMYYKLFPNEFYQYNKLYRNRKKFMNLFFNDKLAIHKKNLLNNNSSFLGAITGDIIGSRFEFHPHRNKEFELFYTHSGTKIPKTVMDHKYNSRFTDDAVMTIAIAKSLLEANGNYNNLDKLAIKNMKELGRKYPFAGYGSRFNWWIQSEVSEPYNSYGNGSAMRISAVPYFANDLEELKDLVYKVTAVSHNHPEGIKGAEAVATCIYLALCRISKKEIKEYIERKYYKLNFNYKDLVKNYTHDETCQNSVPQSIFAFLISDSYEDAVRTAISMGGDADTMACIAGSIAAAYYGIPDEILNEAMKYLTDDLKEIIKRFNKIENEDNKNEKN